MHSFFELTQLEGTGAHPAQTSMCRSKHLRKQTSRFKGSLNSPTAKYISYTAGERQVLSPRVQSH